MITSMAGIPEALWGWGLDDGALARGATRCAVGQERGADLRAAAAAIPHEKARQRLHGLELRAIDDGAAAALRHHEPGAGQHTEMRRQGVVRNRQAARHLARRQPVGLLRHEQAKHVEARGLRERGKSEESIGVVHMSRIIDALSHNKAKLEV